MIKKTITYKDYNGKMQTRTFHFHLNKIEVTKLATSEDGGLENYIQRIVEAEKGGEVLAAFENIVKAAYGVKSPDGQQFVKSEALSEAFVQTPAFVELFTELVEQPEALAKFIEGAVKGEFAADN